MNRKVLENPENRDPWVVALAAALCAVVSVLGALAQSTKPATQSTHSTDSVLVPGRFVDITDKVGVHFLHQAPHTNRKYLIETMGSGVALFDCDNDGRIDLFNANDSMQEFLFHQKVDGTFEEIGLAVGDQYPADAIPISIRFFLEPTPTFVRTRNDDGTGKQDHDRPPRGTCMQKHLCMN
jgi:hypothetical protein